MNQLFTLYPERENIIYYLHGGGFAYEMAPYYFDFFKRLCDKCQCGIIVPIYPKTPKFHSDDIIEMVKKHYLQYYHKNIILMGDSAGGGLCYILCNQLEKTYFPKHIITISPWLDLCSNNPQMIDYQVNDKFLTIKLLQKFAKDFVYPYAVDSKHLNPLSMNHPFFENSSILIGTYDILYPDTVLFANKFQCRLYTYEKAVHCFALLKQYEDAFNHLSQITIDNFTS